MRDIIEIKWNPLTIHNAKDYQENQWYVFDVYDGGYHAWIIRNNVLIYVDSFLDCGIVVNLKTNEKAIWIEDEESYFYVALQYISQEEMDYFYAFSDDNVKKPVFGEIVAKTLIDIDFWGERDR